MNSYKAKCRVKYRLPNENNKSGVSWLKQTPVELEADSIEALGEKMFRLPIPKDIDIEAISVESTIRLLDREKTNNRINIHIDVFREL